MVSLFEQIALFDSSPYSWSLDRSLVNCKKPLEGTQLLRPALLLAGHRKQKASSQPLMVLFDAEEIAFLESLEPQMASERLALVIDANTPAVVVADGASARSLMRRCLETRTPLIECHLHPQAILLQFIQSIEQMLSPTLEIHASLVDVFGQGVLLTGQSGVGKSETALGLIERRHRLVCDDIVKLRLQDQYLVGMTGGLALHHMEVRGIGIINVAHLYGVVSVIDQKRVDLVVELETWDDNHDYDRLGLEWSYSQWLGVKVPHHYLPVKPGRDMVLLVETLALNHRLRAMGHHTARNFTLKLEEEIKRRGEPS